MVSHASLRAADRTDLVGYRGRGHRCRSMAAYRVREVGMKADLTGTSGYRLLRDRS